MSEHGAITDNQRAAEYGSLESLPELSSSTWLSYGASAMTCTTKNYDSQITEVRSLSVGKDPPQSAPQTASGLEAAIPLPSIEPPSAMLGYQTIFGITETQSVNAPHSRSSGPSKDFPIISLQSTPEPDYDPISRIEEVSSPVSKGQKKPIENFPTMFFGSPSWETHLFGSSKQSFSLPMTWNEDEIVDWGYSNTFKTDSESVYSVDMNKIWSYE